MSIRKALSTDNWGARAVVQKSLASFGLVADFDTLDAAIGALGLASTHNDIELVAEVDGKLVGCLAIQRMDMAAAKLFGFHVDAGMQGQGIGHRFIHKSPSFVA